MTRTLFRGAFIAALLLAAPLNATAEMTDKIKQIDTMAVIPFAHSSAELTSDAIRTLSNLAREQRLDVSRRAVIYAGGVPASGPVARLRFAQIRDLLIDLGLPPGQIVLPTRPLCHAPYLTIRGIGDRPLAKNGPGRSSKGLLHADLPAAPKSIPALSCPEGQVPE